jgi:hypothetical protein
MSICHQSSYLTDEQNLIVIKKFKSNFSNISLYTKTNKPILLSFNLSLNETIQLPVNILSFSSVIYYSLPRSYDDLEADTDRRVFSVGCCDDP